MSRTTWYFCAFLVLLVCLVRKSEQNLVPINVLNPLEVGKSPLVTYTLNEYLNKEAEKKQKEETAKTIVANNSTWAILVAGSAGWDNYRCDSKLSLVLGR